MISCMNDNVMWTYLDQEYIYGTPIKLGNTSLKPGIIVDQIGTGETSFMYHDAPLIYCGYVNSHDNRRLLLFKPYVEGPKRPSYISLWYINADNLSFGSLNKIHRVFVNDVVLSDAKKPFVTESNDFEQAALFGDVV